MATKTNKTENTNDFAVIKTGGKQYVVREGDTLKIEKLDQTEGKVVFDEVLAVSKGDNVVVGNPKTNSKVEGEIVGVGRAAKILVMRYKAKSNRLKRAGHRQPFTEVKITSIK